MTNEEVKGWRTSTKRTQQEAADFLGLKVRQYQRIETGETPVKPIYERVIKDDQAKRAQP